MSARKYAKSLCSHYQATYNGVKWNCAPGRKTTTNTTIGRVTLIPFVINDVGVVSGKSRLSSQLHEIVEWSECGCN